MKRSRIDTAVVVLITATVICSIHAEEEYDLRGPAPVKGQVFTVTAASLGKDVTRTIKAAGRTLEEKFDEADAKKKEIEVLAVEEDEITKMRTKIILDQRDEVFRKGKKEVKRTSNRDLHGQFIYSERTKSGWKNSLEDVSPTDKQKRELKEYVPFKEEDLIYPKGKFKVGHTWKIDAATMEKIFGRQMEDFKGSGTGKFLRVEKGADEDVAVIEVELELTGKSKEDELTLDVKIKAKGTAHRSLKFGFDRKSTTVLEMAMKGEGETGGQKLEVEYNAVMNAKDEVELKMRK